MWPPGAILPPGGHGPFIPHINRKNSPEVDKETQKYLIREQRLDVRLGIEGLQVFRFEGNVEIVVEVGLERRYPGEFPAHPFANGFDFALSQVQ